MKRIVILAVAVLLLTLGIGAGLYLFMPERLGLEPEQAAEAPPPPPPMEVKPATVRVAAIDVPVMLDGKAQRQIHFGVTLITKPESQARIADELPRFRNAVIQFAYSGFPEQFSTEGRMDLPRLKATLLVLAKRSLGPDVEDVLIQSYFEM
jgi:flagellar basal body-associated protein FliL